MIGSDLHFLVAEHNAARLRRTAYIILALCVTACALVTLVLLTGCATTNCDGMTFIQTSDAPATFDAIHNRAVIATGLTREQIAQMCGAR